MIHHPNDPYADRTDSLVISTSSSETQPWSTFQEARPKEDIFASVSPSRPTYPWGSSSFPTSRTFPTGRSVSPSSDYLGSRTRPGSYGRASWGEANGNQALGSNTVQMYPDVSSTRSTRPEWSSSPWDSRQSSTSPSE